MQIPVGRDKYKISKLLRRVHAEMMEIIVYMHQDTGQGSKRLRFIIEDSSMNEEH